MSSKQGAAQKHIAHFDIARGIAMLCIIVGHLGIQQLNAVVFIFHVPIFFIISGYFFHRRQSGALRHYVRHLLLPYLYTCIGIVLGKLVRAAMLGNDLLATAKDWTLRALFGSGSQLSYFFGIGSIGALWFLLALFIAQLMYTALEHNKYCVPVIALLYASALISAPHVWLPFSVQSACLALTYIHIGRLLRQHESSWHVLDSFDIKRLALAALVFVAVLLINQGEISYSLAGAYSAHPLTDILGALSGSYLVISFAMLLEKLPKLGRALEWFGRHTLQLLCLHVLDLELFPWATIQRSLSSVPQPLFVVVRLVLCTLGYCAFVMLAERRHTKEHN